MCVDARGTLAVLLLLGQAVSSQPQPYSPRIRAVPQAARPLPLTAVRLTGGPLKRAQDATAEYLLALEPDRMLAYYRERAGLPKRAEPYGGWDGDGRNLTGHIAGHYLSAVSLMWAATGDTRFKQRADYVVQELKVVQEKHGDGFVGALAGVREAFGEVGRGNIRPANFDLNGLWSPWYVLHKTYAGLRDAYRHTGNRTALEIEVGFAGWAERVLAPLTAEQMQRVLAAEFGGMNEVLADLYSDTGDRRWLALSKRFEHRAVLDPLKRREDPLQGLHGNTQVPKVLGSLARFEAAGDAADGVAAGFFWDRVVRSHTFATGGHGKDEYFREPGRLGNIVDGRTAETCNVYNMLKMTRALFALRPSIDYAEFHERALFNHILGSIDPSDGAMCYMVPVGRGVRREYQDMFRSFTCCVGSGMESHALHGDGLYFESGDRLWVNLYVPSTAQWRDAGATLEMQTDFPEGESATLRLRLDSPRSFTLALRRPSWAGERFAILVNGERVQQVGAPGTYVELARTWKTGDTVSLLLPKQLRIESTPDRANLAAIFWGPLVLAGDLGPEPERGARGASPSRPRAPVLLAAGQPITAFVKPDATRPGVFRTDGVGRDRDVELVPFYRLHRRVYSAYWDVLTPAEYDRRRADEAAEAERVKELESRTILFFSPGDEAQEKVFNRLGEDAPIVRVDGRAGRRTSKWFSYDMAVPAGETARALVLTYNTDQRRHRRFEIAVDGQRLKDETLEESSVARFVDVQYPLPAAVSSGPRTLVVRFGAAPDSEVPAVFGIRLVR